MIPAIHAINGRDNGLLEWLYNESGKDPVAFRRLITSELGKLSDLLMTRDISYSSLKTALVPSREGRQIVFLYDWYGHEGNYAIAFMKLWMPLVRKQAKFTTKSGDLLGLPEFVSEFEGIVVKARDETVRWNTLYAAYFNNLTPVDVDSMHAALSSDARYRGYLDVTFAGEARDFVAGRLTFAKIFFNGNVLLSHGADEPVMGEVDPLGYPYQEYGFSLTTIVDWYFYPFLDYKIESYADRGFVNDSILSLAVATGEYVDPRYVPVYVHPDKLEKYLLRNESKLALMTSIGLQEIGADELGQLVSDHLQSNYIYDMRLAEDGTPTFAICAEFEKADGELVKRLIALKLDRLRGHIALTSMY